MPGKRIRIDVIAPEDLRLSGTLEQHVTSVLARAQIAYSIPKPADEEMTRMQICLHDPSDSESRFIIRMLRRAGYNLFVSE